VFWPAGISEIVVPITARDRRTSEEVAWARTTTRWWWRTTRRPFVAAYIRKHPEYQSLVRADG
jgi:hypothetical protein